MRMMVSADRARALLARINHSSCQSAIARHWDMGADGQVEAANFLWLFCWAATGMNSEAAKAASCTAFEEIFGLKFRDAAAKIPHDGARAKRDDGTVTDDEIHTLLGSRTAGAS